MTSSSSSIAIVLSLAGALTGGAVLMVCWINDTKADIAGNLVKQVEDANDKGTKLFPDNTTEVPESSSKPTLTNWLAILVALKITLKPLTTPQAAPQAAKTPYTP